jgi:hypothetical protein
MKIYFNFPQIKILTGLQFRCILNRFKIIKDKNMRIFDLQFDTSCYFKGRSNEIVLKLWKGNIPQEHLNSVHPNDDVYNWKTRVFSERRK